MRAPKGSPVLGPKLKQVVDSNWEGSSTVFSEPCTEFSIGVVISKECKRLTEAEFPMEAVSKQTACAKRAGRRTDGVSRRGGQEGVGNERLSGDREGAREGAALDSPIPLPNGRGSNVGKALPKGRGSNGGKAHVDHAHPDGRGSKLNDPTGAVPDGGGSNPELGLNPDDVPIAYFISFTCYGTWLHGDERGSVDCRHNLYGTPVLPADPHREQQDRERMT
jgi:hypothetical protein